MATNVLGLHTFTASEPWDFNIVNDNSLKIDNGVKTAMQGRAAQNLLDNSWFVNPVNQRGFSSTTSTGDTMCLDRWLFSVNSGGSISLTASGLVCQNANLIQKIESKLLNSSKEYTQVFWLADGTPIFPTKWIEFNYSSGVWRVVYYGITGTVVAAALYEGSYTADTLPAYVPKDNELAECKLHHRIMQTPCIPCANNPAGKQVYGYIQGTMRIAPTVICDKLFYFHGDGTYVKVTGATAALAGDGIRIAFDLENSVIENLAGVVGGTAITFDANM